MIGIVGQGKMGGSYQELGTPAAPAAAHSASNSVLGDKAPLGFVPYSSISSCNFYSFDRGKLLGAARPAWIKVQESETRLQWLKSMVEKGLVVRQIESYAQAESIMLRTEEMRVKEKERDVLKGRHIIEFSCIV